MKGTWETIQVNFLYLAKTNTDALFRRAGLL